jgi:hypothetical protein
VKIGKIDVNKKLKKLSGIKAHYQKLRPIVKKRRSYFHQEDQIIETPTDKLLNKLAGLPLPYQEEQTELENVTVTNAILEAIVTKKRQELEAAVAKLNLEQERLK